VAILTPYMNMQHGAI